MFSSRNALFDLLPKLERDNKVCCLSLVNREQSSSKHFIQRYSPAPQISTIRMLTISAETKRSRAMDRCYKRGDFGPLAWRSILFIISSILLFTDIFSQRIMLVNSLVTTPPNSIFRTLPCVQSGSKTVMHAEKTTPLMTCSRRRSKQTARVVGGGMDSTTTPTTTSTALNGLQTSSSSSSSSSGHHRCNELEFEMHVGKAMDTLRKDYAELFVKSPDFSIYCKDMEFVDPSGVRVHGLYSYRNAYRLLNAIVKFLYCPEKSCMTSARMFFDPVKRNIRLSWNAEVVPRDFFGGTRSILHVDGISVYEVSRETGDVVQHRLEYLIMNNQAIQPEEGLVAALQQYHGVTIPNCPNCFRSKESDTQPQQSDRDFFTLQFVPFKTKRETLLFTESRSNLHSFEASRSDGGDDVDGFMSSADINWNALEQKNKSRKKFGMPPLTPDEFRKLETQIKTMDAEQQVRRQQQEAAAAAARAQEEKRNQKNRILDKLFGNVLKDTCETNFDCERPELCCDFGFKKMCCSTGSPVLGQNPQYATVPVPVEVADYPGQPPSRY